MSVVIVSSYRMRGLRVAYRRGDAAWVRRVLRAACVWGTVPFVGSRDLLTPEELERVRSRRPRAGEVPFDAERPSVEEVLALRGCEVVS